MRMVAVAFGAVFLVASFATSNAAPARCDDDDVVSMMNNGNGPKNGKEPPAYGKNCEAPPVSPPGRQGGNPGNNKDVGNAGEKGEPVGQQDKGNSQKTGQFDPKAPKATP